METVSQKQKALILFSGGKDSVFALYEAVKDGYEPILLSFVNDAAQVQFTDGPEIDALFWKEYLSLFNSYKSFSITTTGLNESLVVKINSIAQEEGLQIIYTGDLGHPDGIDILLKQHLHLSVITPGSTYVESYGRKAYMERLISLGFIMTIISVRSDVADTVEVGKTLTIQYLDYLESKEIDCTGEDGEFQTIVTDCPLLKKSLQIDLFSVEKLTGRDKKGFEYKKMTSIKFSIKNK